MRYNSRNFNLKKNKIVPVDEFINKALYEPKFGYYTNRLPFGEKGDFITSPTISNLFSEIITVWVVSAWEKLGKPKNFNFVELGPGDGSLARVFVDTVKKFPDLDRSINIYLYEKSNFLKKVQKNKLKDSKVKWINNFDGIKKGPIIFFGNEFFDAIPIKQFIYKKKQLLEKNFIINSKLKLDEVYQYAKADDIRIIKNYKSLKGLKFIEFPKLGLSEMDKIVKKIKLLTGGILLIDYGYLNEINRDTIQIVMANKKIDKSMLLKNIGKADITSLVNFKLLKEYFEKKNIKVEKIVSQKFFLEKMGIINRAKILEKKMSIKQKTYMSTTLMRLLHKKLMGGLFKVIFAFKSSKVNFLGFN